MILNAFAKRWADSLKLRLAEWQAPCVPLRGNSHRPPLFCKTRPDLKRISFKLAFF